MSHVLSGAKLKEIATANPTAEATMLNLALRRRMRSVQDLRTTKRELLSQNEKVVEEDYMKFWKDLQAAGVGSLVYGRNGRPDRFEWNYNLKTVAQSAIEGVDIATVRISDEEKKADAKEEEKEETKQVEVKPVPESTVKSLKEKLEQRRTTAPVEKRQRRKAVAQASKPAQHRRGRRASMVEFSLTKSEATLLQKLLGKLKK